VMGVFPKTVVILVLCSSYVWYAVRDGSSLQSAVPDECLTENEVPPKPSKTGMASLEKVGPILQG